MTTVSKVQFEPKWKEELACTIDGRRFVVELTMGVLTVASINLPQGPHPYVNSLWEIQKDPYTGDVVSSYNDGPPEPGAPSWGAFYEMETTSPAAELPPGGTLTHTHRTFHFSGDRAKLDSMGKHLFGVGLVEMEAFAGA